MNLQANQTRKIQLLPEHIIDQIKAGEVVERPSALLKELIENSIDAGSTRIDIQIKNNGLELISIEDNGDGMDLDELPYAFCRHATSKISQFDDLYRLHSYGFRGEALASICSISRITCTSSPKSDPARGGKIVFFGGKQEDWSPLPSSTHGTSLFVKDLFYNTPARLKFLKSKTAEKNALQRVFNAFLLTQPENSFSIKWDDKEKTMFPSCSKNDIKKRVSRVFFKKKFTEENLSQIVEVNVEYEGVRLRGFYSTTTTKGASGKSQYFFMNDRMFIDKALHLAFMRAAENVWPHGEYGHYCFFIDLPPDQVDVNVHPGKIHIKFLKPNIIFGLISNSVKKRELIQEENTGSSASSFNAESIWNTYSSQTESTQSPHLENRHGQKVFSINDHFMLYRSEDEPTLLINKNIFVKELLKYSLINNIDINGTPLLIGEALIFPKGEIDTRLCNMTDLGFDIDRADNNTLILRTVPPLLISLNFQELVFPMLKYLEECEGFKTIELINNLEKNLHKTLKTIRFESLWNKIPSNNLILSKAIKVLDDESLIDFFTEDS